MDLLINKTDIEKYFQVAIGRKDSEIEKFIQQAQLYDLKKLFPEKLFYDLLKNKTENNYLKLLKGGPYVYSNFNYEFEGIEACLSAFTYARYILHNNIQDTSYGIKSKSNQYSTDVDYKEKYSLSSEYRKQANVLFEGAVNYLNRNKEQFPIWEECTAIKRNFTTNIIQ